MGPLAATAEGRPRGSRGLGLAEHRDDEPEKSAGNAEREQSEREFLTDIFPEHVSLLKGLAL
ncbi:hypothetical protein IZ6_14140 [Terrihabitans soli]|uniref:Uncharacterized protein n=1 Tax=Terrihabitans soli TaxID=708113 RepID=A0A6S6QNZ7_9HYPH|nr:hypothetical protein IZ6_14140 [Terrihabitans soli]